MTRTLEFIFRREPTWRTSEMGTLCEKDVNSLFFANNPNAFVLLVFLAHLIEGIIRWVPALKVEGGRNSTRGKAERRKPATLRRENIPIPPQPSRVKKSRRLQIPLRSAEAICRNAFSFGCALAGLAQVSRHTESPWGKAVRSANLLRVEDDGRDHRHAGCGKMVK